MRFSRTLAFVFGALAPLLETARRWGSWWDDPPAYLDDWLLGAALIAGAWAAGRSERGVRLLAAAWGLACGMGWYSCFGQLASLERGDPDPAPIASEAVLAIKVAGTMLAAVALVVTVRARRGGAPSAP